MARIRSIKPEFWTSEQVMECSTNARLLFIGLWNFCDDHGRHPVAPKQIKALIFPADDFSAENVRGMIDELSTNDLITIYIVDGKEYLQVTGWQHQKIDRPQKPKYPSPIDGHSSNGIDGIQSAEGNTEKENDSAEPIGSDGDASGRVVPFDARKSLFDEALPLLSRYVGKPIPSLRGLVGKWLKATDDDALKVNRLIAQAVNEQRADPIAWIERSIKPKDPTEEIWRGVL